MRFGNVIFTFLILSLFTIIHAAYGIEEVIFEEDFEGLTLEAAVNEEVKKDEVWTNEPPDGWSIENDLNSGMPEWNGWAFADGSWWMQTAGDQERNRFINGKAVGIIAIADPDEWDDLGGPGGTYNTWLSTPPINISGVVANSLVLTFDSSWRPEDTQAAEVTVSFDGGAAIVLIRMDSSGSNTIYKEPHNNVEETIPDLDQVNETIELNVPNPAGAGTAVIAWAMLDATNDWWWSIDNISVRTTSDVTAVSSSGKLSTLWGAIKSK